MDPLFFRELNEDFDLTSFKIVLFTLSNAKLPEKYRCMSQTTRFLPSPKIDDFPGFFRQITSPNVIASQLKLTELFEILLKVPNHFDNVDSFHPENIAGCVQSCLDHVRREERFEGG